MPTKIDIGLTPGQVAGLVAERIREHPEGHHQGDWIGTYDEEWGEVDTSFSKFSGIEHLEAEFGTTDPWECDMVACVGGHAAIVAYQHMTDAQRARADREDIEDIATDVLGLPRRDNKWTMELFWIFATERTRGEVLEYLDSMTAGEQETG